MTKRKKVRATVTLEMLYFEIIMTSQIRYGLHYIKLFFQGRNW